MPLIHTLQEAFLAGKLQSNRFTPITPTLTSMLNAWGESIGGMSIEVLYAALVIWSRVHGLVMMEIGAQMPAYITSPGEIYRCEIENIKKQYLRE